MYEGRSKPGLQIVGLVTVVWLTTETDSQSSLQCAAMLTGVMTDHSGYRDVSRGGPLYILTFYLLANFYLVVAFDEHVLTFDN